MSVPAGKAPIIECVREGFAFVRDDWRGIVPVAALLSLILAPLQAFMEAAQASANVGQALLVLAAITLVSAVLSASLLRRRLREGEPIRLDFGRDEQRLFAASLLLSFFALIVLALGFVLLLLAIVAVMLAFGVSLEALGGLTPQAQEAMLVREMGPGGVAVMALLFAGAFGVAAFLAARLSLWAPATLSAGRVRIFSTWRWTHGNAWRIAAILAIVFLIGFVSVNLALLAPALFAQAAGFNPAEPGPGRWILLYLASVVQIMLLVAPLTGATAHLYRGLRPPAERAEGG